MHNTFLSKATKTSDFSYLSNCFTAPTFPPSIISRRKCLLCMPVSVYVGSFSFSSAELGDFQPWQGEINNLSIKVLFFAVFILYLALCLIKTKKTFFISGTRSSPNYSQVPSNFSISNFSSSCCAVNVFPVFPNDLLKWFFFGKVILYFAVSVIICFKIAETIRILWGNQILGSFNCVIYSAPCRYRFYKTFQLSEHDTLRTRSTSWHSAVIGPDLSLIHLGSPPSFLSNQSCGW